MTDDDIRHLRRCIELAELAVERGDDPFGSVLVDENGDVVAERQNRVHTTGDRTAHPELELARWASRHLDPARREAATMYTSGEHCAMCAAAHVWAGIGRLVFVLSGEMIREASESESGTSIDISAREVVSRSNVDVTVEGPCEQLAPLAAELFTRRP